jgi:site-specific recombinase XerD
MSERYCVVRSGASYRLTASDDAQTDEANRFLEAAEARCLSPKTIRAYAFDLLCLYRWLAQCGKTLASLRAKDLLEFISYQQQKGAHPGSINRRLLVCRLCYRFHTDAEIEAQVAAPVPHTQCRDRSLGLHIVGRWKKRPLRVKMPKPLIRPLEKHEVNHFFKTIRRYRDAAMVYLMLFCGLRSQEVLTLRLCDLFFDEGSLRVLGKGNKERMLPLPDLLKDVIARYLQFERPSICTSPHLFVVLQGNRRGRPMTAEGLRSLFRSRRRRRGLESANPHRFRHTFGTDMARQGVKVPVLKALMGHTDIETTMLYIHLSMADVTQEYHRALTEIRSRYDRKKNPLVTT